jgi:protein-tyrosine phosphatase
VIDIHHHCLPGVDDGPRDWEEAVDLCRMAGEEGIETIIATPHVLRGRWRQTPPATLASLAGELQEKVGPKPRILLGSEYFFAHDMADAVREGTAVVPLAGSKYILVEFASHAIPPMVEQPFYRLQLDGYTPVIAHPERNSVFQAKPELLVSLVQAGARTQVTASSFTGMFGSAAREAAVSWLRAGLVHFIATDAHNTKKRPPKIREALEVVQELAGERVATALTRDNPQAVLDGTALPYEPDPQMPTKQGGLMSKVRRLFGPREDS